jgi:hypothetical protein
MRGHYCTGEMEADSLGCHHMKIRVERLSATFSVFRRSLQSNRCHVCDVAPVPKTLDVLNSSLETFTGTRLEIPIFRHLFTINLLFYFILFYIRLIVDFLVWPMNRFAHFVDVGWGHGPQVVGPRHFYPHGFKKINPWTDLDKPLVFQEVEAPRISRHSTHESGKAVGSKHRPSVPSRRFSWYPFLLEAWIDSRAIVRLKGWNE